MLFSLLEGNDAPVVADSGAVTHGLLFAFFWNALWLSARQKSALFARGNKREIKEERRSGRGAGNSAVTVVWVSRAAGAALLFHLCFSQKMSIKRRSCLQIKCSSLLIINQPIHFSEWIDDVILSHFSLSVGYLCFSVTYKKVVSICSCNIKNKLNCN